MMDRPGDRWQADPHAPAPKMLRQGRSTAVDPVISLSNVAADGSRDGGVRYGFVIAPNDPRVATALEGRVHIADIRVFIRNATGLEPGRIRFRGADGRTLFHPDASCACMQRSREL